MDENQLYVEQIKLWVEEQKVLADQIRSTIKASEEVTDLNRKQLSLHTQRISIGIEEFNKWAQSKGIDEIEDWTKEEATDETMADRITININGEQFVKAIRSFLNTNGDKSQVVRE